MLKTAKDRGFEPEYMLMDIWYSGLENLKLVRGFGWLFLTRLKSNRLINPDGKGNVPISQVEIPAEGRVVHLRGFGFVKVLGKRAGIKRQGWGIEVYHRGLKQCCGEGTGSQSRGHCAPSAFASLFAVGSLSFEDRGELV